MKYEYGAANLVSKFTGGRKVEQDHLKQLKIELDQSTQKCDEMEREFRRCKSESVIVAVAHFFLWVRACWNTGAVETNLQ